MDPKLGGPPDGVRTLIESFNKIGIKSGLAVIDCPTSPWLQNINAEILAVRGFGKYKFSINFLVKLNKFVKNFDVIIIHGVWQFHSVAASIICLKQKSPYFQYLHGALDKWFREEYIVKHFKKVIYFQLIEKKILKNSNGILYTSDGEIASQDKGFKIENSNKLNVGFSKNYLNQKKILSRKNLEKIIPAIKNKTVILFLSRIHKKKGIDLLIKAIHRIDKVNNRILDDYVFLIVGPCGDFIKLDIFVEQYNLGKLIVRIDWVEDKIKWSLLKHSDLLCLPSYSENWGAVVVESIMCGTPVLISNRVNIYKDIDDGNCGLICDPNVSSVASTLLYWMKSDKLFKKSLEENCEKTFFHRYDSEKNIKNLLNSLESNLSSFL